MKKGVVLACLLAVLSLTASVYTIVKVNNNSNEREIVKEVTARNIMLRQSEDYLQWKYDDEENWKNLISISLLKGADGKDGKDGVDGRNGTNGKDGTNGSNGSNGADGRDGTNGKDGTNGSNGSNGTNGSNGKDGREVEFKVEGTKIYWKFNTATEWTLLVDISTIEEEPIENTCETRDIIADKTVSCIANGTTCTAGTLLKINLTTNENDTPANFYVIEDNQDTGKLTLLADSNIVLGNKFNFAWNEGTAGNNSYGPNLAMKTLNNYTTSKWDNVCNIENYTYENEGHVHAREATEELPAVSEGNQYLSISIVNGTTKIVNGDGTETTIDGETKARMLTYSEAREAGGCQDKDGRDSFCNDWMYANLVYGDSTKPSGYWLLASNTSSKNADVIVMKNNNALEPVEQQGKLDSSSTITNNSRGIRPVIEVTKPSSN